MPNEGDFAIRQAEAMSRDAAFSVLSLSSGAAIRACGNFQRR